MGVLSEKPAILSKISNSNEPFDKCEIKGCAGFPLSKYLKTSLRFNI